MPQAADYQVAWSASAQAYHVQQTRDQAMLAILPDSPACCDWLELE
jgi:hypothetical protein